MRDQTPLGELRPVTREESAPRPGLFLGACGVDAYLLKIFQSFIFTDSVKGRRRAKNSYVKTLCLKDSR